MCSGFQCQGAIPTRDQHGDNRTPARSSCRRWINRIRRFYFIFVAYVWVPTGLRQRRDDVNYPIMDARCKTKCFVSSAYHPLGTLDESDAERQRNKRCGYRTKHCTLGAIKHTYKHTRTHTRYTHLAIFFKGGRMFEAVL